MLHDNERLTRELAEYNTKRLLPGVAVEPHPYEIGYIESIRKAAAADRGNVELSMDWYSSLLTDGPGQGDPLFDWLAESATMEQMKWFLHQEAAGEAGFDDLVAMTQVKMPTQAKLEMARNYWDEMGRGQEKAMHGLLLKEITTHLDIHPTPETTLPEPLLLVNLMTGLACHRRYAYLAVGALGVIEMTAPGRVGKVDQGLKRLGVPLEIRRYFALHATLDVAHSREWNAEVIGPLVASFPDIAEGAYLRLWAGRRCFTRYRMELGWADGI